MMPHPTPSAGQPLKMTENNKSSCCPICDSSDVVLLSPSWKRYHNEKEFFLSEKEWFAGCDCCGTIFRYPLLNYEDYKKYGEDYYNLVNPGESVEEHATWHYESFQKPNYDALRVHLNQILPPVEAKRWLDVGSVGYATTFDEYDFTTIEPDERIVMLGRKLFQPKGLKSLIGKKAKIYCNTIENFQDGKLFDGIVFNNSFYCLPFPMEGLFKAAKLLRPEGHLLITISTFFCDATAVRTDGQLSRIEDVLQGETLWVFHNQKSLEYLCQRAGFELIETHEIACYGKKTMRAFHFRKSLSTAPEVKLLAESKELMVNKLEQLFSDFSRQTENTLTALNAPNIFFVGTLTMLNDLAHLKFIDNIPGFVVFDTPIRGGKVGNINCVSWEYLSGVVEDNPGQYSVVIFSYKYQDEIHAKVSPLSSRMISLLRPNRKSGIEALNFVFDGAIRPCKGFTLDADA